MKTMVKLILEVGARVEKELDRFAANNEDFELKVSMMTDDS